MLEAARRELLEAAPTSEGGDLAPGGRARASRDSANVRTPVPAAAELLEAAAMVRLVCAPGGRADVSLMTVLARWSLRPMRQECLGPVSNAGGVAIRLGRSGSEWYSSCLGLDIPL